jgi:hypothetical protein
MNDGKWGCQQLPTEPAAPTNQANAFILPTTGGAMSGRFSRNSAPPGRPIQAFDLIRQDNAPRLVALRHRDFERISRDLRGNRAQHAQARDAVVSSRRKNKRIAFVRLFLPCLRVKLEMDYVVLFRTVWRIRFRYQPTHRWQLPKYARDVGLLMNSSKPASEARCLAIA